MARPKAKSNGNQKPKKRASGRGGKRSGAGRPKSAVAVIKLDAKAYTAGRITEALPQILDSLITLAKSGDMKAISETLNRLLGRPTEATPDENKTLTVGWDDEAKQLFDQDFDTPPA